MFGGKPFLLQSGLDKCLQVYMKHEDPGKLVKYTGVETIPVSRLQACALELASPLFLRDGKKNDVPYSSLTCHFVKKVTCAL